jgi:hypothetical protein
MEVLTNYEVPEDFILKWGPGDSEFNGIDKSLVISIMNLSEDFIKAALISEYFNLDDIYELNMITYSGLSEEFINEYENYINWSRMILYLSSSDKIENIEKFESIIEKHNLWNLISANPLPIDFIRKNKEKIDWKIASIVNKFTEDERVEFNDLIIIYTDVVPNLDEIDEVYTVSDIRVQSCLWSMDNGGINESIVCGQNITQNWDEGINNITIFVNDSVTPSSVNGASKIDGIVNNPLIMDSACFSNVITVPSGGILPAGDYRVYWTGSPFWQTKPSSTPRTQTYYFQINQVTI